MTRNEFETMICGLSTVIADYRACKNELSKCAMEDLVVAYTKSFLKKYFAPQETTEKKSESACNSKSDETPNNSDFQATSEAIKKALTALSKDEGFISAMARLAISNKKKG